MEPNHGAKATSRTPSVGRCGAVYIPVPIREPKRHRNYGTVTNPSAATNRSVSVPVHSTRVVFYKRPLKPLTVSQQSARLAEKVSKNFFHANFNSGHGTVFTIPNRAQQKAYSRPSSRAPSAAGRHPMARNNSAAHRAQARPIALDVPVLQPSALKRAPEANKDDIFDPIVIRRRPASADARLNIDIHEVDRLEQLEKRTSSIEAPKIALPESSPDLLALEAMRASGPPQKQHLSPSTIARAAKALKKFEESKVRMPTGSFSSVTEVAVDGRTIAVPEKTPLRLSITREEPPPQRRVQICTVVNAESASEEEATTEESEEEVVGWCGGVMDILYLGAPAAISICFTFAMSVIPLAFVGSYRGALDLNGASVGYFLICIILLYPMLGLTFAIDTLCSHVYGRDPLSPEMGLILQRGILINCILLVPMCVSLYFLRPFLIWVYGETTATLAMEFLTYVPFEIFPGVLFYAFTKFLNNQMQPHIPMIALTAGVLITPPLQMKLTPMGVRYTMVGMAITAWFQLIVMVLITLFKAETRITLGHWRLREALDWEDVKQYMKLAIPSAIFVAAEASSFDLTVLLCAKFSEADGAAWSAIMNSLYIFSSFSGGLSASACANIGSSIGGNDPLSARRYVIITICIAFALGLVDSTIIVLFYDNFMAVFGTTGRTLELANQVLFMLPFFHTCDAVQFAFQGIFSGLGKNHLGALILLTSLWGIGIPLSILMGHFLDYRMFGVCAGITIGLCIEAPTMVIVALRINYTKVCEQFIEDEEEEESEEEEEEESEEDEEHDEEYVEEVMRRSGISSSSQEPHEEYPEHYKKLLPPKKRRRGRRVYYEEEDEEEE